MMRVLVLAILVLAASGAALGQQQPLVRAKVTPESVTVGEPAELTVTVLVPTWFTRPPVYPPFELANAMTRMPADSSYPIRERVGGESWSGIVRTYEIYPLLGASYRMAGQAMTVTFANPGSDPISVGVEVPEVMLRGVVPEGAEALDPYIAGRSLTLALDVEGALDDLGAGDAIVLTYRAELEFEGVSAYRDIPEVKDGETAVRAEKVTLVFDSGGEFSVPGMQLSFWNTASQSIETAAADGLVVSVEGPPAPFLADGESTAKRWPVVATIVGMVVLILVLWRGLPLLAHRYREAAERRRLTEDHAFRQLLSALESGDSAEVYRALMRWIERLERGLDARSFAAHFGDEYLSEAITALSARLYGDAGNTVDLGRIRRKLKVARRRYLDRDTISKSLRLPPLNP
jgi:hypothetical protein